MNVDWAQLSQTIVVTAVAVGLRLIGALIVWIVGRYLIGLAVRMITRTLERQHVDSTLLRYIGSLVSVSLNVLLVVAILGYLLIAVFYIIPIHRLRQAGRQVGAEDS